MAVAVGSRRVDAPRRQQGEPESLSLRTPGVPKLSCRGNACLSSFSLSEPKLPPLAIQKDIVYLVCQKSYPNPTERLFSLNIKNNLLYS